MSDLGSSNWSETDASNNAAVPNGWPEGMQPSGVNNSARANMGGEKRFWNRINAVKTTGGTTSAYTLTYDVAAAQYYDGEIHSFVVNATNAVDATLNINGIGARQLRLFEGNILAGALLADQIVQVRYNLADTAFDIIPQNGWVRLGEQDPSGAATVDFEDIPAGVKHIEIKYNLRMGTDNTSLSVRTYGADGVLDSGASDYSYTNWRVTSTPASGGDASASASAIVLATAISNGVQGIGGKLEATDIQASLHTNFQSKLYHLEASTALYATLVGGGSRKESDRITGIRFLPSSGTITGKITLFASA